MPHLAIYAVLFDLDGTLLDSAPDLTHAMNRLRQEHGLPALPLATLRPVVGTGARGMLAVGLGVTPQEAEFESLRVRFLSFYAEQLLGESTLFAQVPGVLAELQRAGVAWGIVTNKATRFAEPIVRGLAALAGAQVLVCGDTTAQSKPHPEPLLHACRVLGVAPERTVYVGDDERDIVAGRAAGTHTIAAAWGYLGQGEPVATWGADVVHEHPHQLLNWLNLA
jgi:phosphoglycolate phosphatase